MHIAIAGFNAWAIILLTAALAGGLLGADWHLTAGLLAAVVAALAHSAVFALFIGAAKTVKETVRIYRLPAGFIERTNRIYFRLFPWATGAAVATVLAAVLGGPAGWSPALRHTHGGFALLAYAVALVAAVVEYRQLKAMHLLLREVDRAVPPEAEAALERERDAGREPPREGAAPVLAPDPRARGKAILTLSGLALATLLGYRFLAGARISDGLLLLLGLPLAALLVLGLYRMARASAGRG